MLDPNEPLHLTALPTELTPPLYREAMFAYLSQQPRVDTPLFRSIVSMEVEKLMLQPAWTDASAVSVDGLDRYRKQHRLLHRLIRYGLNNKNDTDLWLASHSHHSINWITLDIAVIRLEQGNLESLPIILEHGLSNDSGYFQTKLSKLLRQYAPGAVSIDEIWPTLYSDNADQVYAALKLITKIEKAQEKASLNQAWIEFASENLSANVTGHSRLTDVIAADGRDNLSRQPGAVAAIRILGQSSDPATIDVLKSLYHNPGVAPLWRDGISLMLAEKGDSLGLAYIDECLDHPNNEVRRWAQKFKQEVTGE